ncbi:MAG: sulfur-oxidizing protein SoxA [Candidatus Azotimanducaceae bacterium]|jgi:sulfur-oxidizing protein SoxA
MVIKRNESSPQMSRLWWMQYSVRNTVMLASLVLGNCSLFMGVFAEESALDVNPEADRAAMVAFYKKRFPEIEVAEHKDGSYALDAGKRAQWLEIEEFPPYEIDVDEGEVLFFVPFKNGKSYANCFENNGIGVKQNYPYFDLERGEVITLDYAINLCRETNGEAPLDYLGEEMGYISAYMAFTSRGNHFDIKVPEAGLVSYAEGKKFYYTRRGQLDFACSSCHITSAGSLIRAEVLSASIGHATHWPTYRLKWDELGGLHRRFIECNEQIGAEGLEPQGKAYRNLEYFLTYMNNGMELNGPGSRK